MPQYHFYLNDGHSGEDHVLEFKDDASAIAEGLKTATGLMADVDLLDVGSRSYLLKVSGNGETIFKVEVQMIRSR
jgi:hypothetical protein